jgi:hypothetical protein
VKILIARSGGFAGFEREAVASVDTVCLDPARAGPIEAALARLAAEEPPVGTDMIRYDVEVTDDDGRRRCLTTFDDGDPNNPARALLQAVGIVP